LTTRRNINAGAPGSKKHLKKSGDKLIYVRYKYDVENNIRQTTVELKEDERPIKQRAVFPVNKNMLVR
jgi:hypothetical protein